MPERVGMRQIAALASLWPGLPRLWRHGSTSALLVALGFAVLLNSVLLTSYVQPDLVVPWLRQALWWVLLIGWVANLWLSQRLVDDQRPRPSSGGDEGLFLQAQAEYLRGHWFEAESLLRTLLHATPQDVDARLLLASLLRRSGRPPEAATELRTLAATPGASKWSFEFEREQALLEHRDPSPCDDESHGGESHEHESQGGSSPLAA
jgi:hypothetical protein